MCEVIAIANQKGGGGIGLAQKGKVWSVLERDPH